MTSAYTINLDSQGYERVAYWSDWKCDGEMRWVRSDETSTEPSRLQQQWYRLGTGASGAITRTEYEWRDVPLVILPRECR